MRIFKRLLLFLSCCIMIIGCNRMPIGGGFTMYQCNSFVFGYWQPRKNVMYAEAQKHGVISVGCGDGSKYRFGSSIRKGKHNEYNEEDHQRYLDKCEEYKDNGYDTLYYVISSAYGPSFGYHYFAEEILSVKINYSQEWAEGYPAGSDLGEFFSLYTISPLDYIRRGYKDPISCKGHPDEDIFRVIQELNLCDSHVGYRTEDGSIRLSNNPNTFDNFYGEPVVRKVSELTSDDLRLIGGGDCIDGECILFVLKPDSLPADLTGELTITVTTDRYTYTVPFTGLEELEKP